MQKLTLAVFVATLGQNQSMQRLVTFVGSQTQADEHTPLLSQRRSSLKSPRFALTDWGAERLTAVYLEIQFG